MTRMQGREELFAKNRLDFNCSFPQGAALAGPEGQSELVLMVRNTFLDAQEPPNPLRRTWSEPSIGTSSDSEWSSALGDSPSGCGTEASAQADIAPETFIFPSHGSAGHALGQCKPCCFLKRNKCMKGADCSHCHYTLHEMPTRPGKKTRERAKLKALKGF